MGLFRNRNTPNSRYLCSFGSDSVFGMNGITVHSAPDSRMNRMKGIRFVETRNSQNTCSSGKFLAGNPTRPPARVQFSGHLRHGYSVFRRSVLYEIEIPRFLLFLNRNKNSQNSPKRTHPELIRRIN